MTQARLPDRRLYIDESGDHSPCADEDGIGKRYLGLVGVMFERGATYEGFAADLEALKKKHFHSDPDDPLVLHREDIVYRRGPFWRLKDEAVAKAFDNDLAAFIESASCTVIAVVIDKATHSKKTYRHLRHPYHYCLQALLERYCGLLNLKGWTGDVVAESRGKTEDRALKEAYTSVHQWGTSYLKSADAQKALTTREIKLKPKGQNIAGLQLADLLANPLTRDVLVLYRRLEDRGGPFADRVATAALKKYNKHLWNGRTQGYGRVLLD